MKKITFLILLGVFWHGSKAQQVAGYSFAQTTEAYTAVSGTTSSASGDDGSQNNIAIGFPFNFGGAEYTTFSISTNGFIRLGSGVGASSWTNGFTNTLAQAPLIAAFWDDNNRGTGTIQYSVSGVAPNRTLEVGWNQVNIGNNGQPNSAVSASYKIRLSETSNVIEMIYGPQMTWSGGVTASIGINDLVSYLSVSPAAGGASASSTVSNNAIVSTQYVVNNKYVFSPPPMCAGAPVAGTTLSSSGSVCSSFPFTLSLSNLQTDAGIGYQWQSSPDGVNYNDIANATTASIAMTQTSTTYYRCIVSCALGEAATSTPVVVGMNLQSTCFCLPTYTFGKTDGDLISNVVIVGTTLSNNTGSVPQNPAYTYFTGQPNYTASLEPGLSYEIQITVGSYGQQNSAAWIDYNDDAIFSPQERVGYTTAQVGSFGTAVYTISLPCDAPAGVHRMRVRDVYNTAGVTIEPCGNYGYGETEDYDIVIVPQTTCPVATGLEIVALGAYTAELQWTSGCGQISWDVHVVPAGEGLPGGTASHPNATSPLVVNGLEADTAYEFFVRANCGAIGNGDWTGPFEFTTFPEPPANDDCIGAYALQVGTSFDQYAIVTSNAGATKSSGQPDPTCAAYNFGGDVWYSVVVPPTGNVTIETRSETGSPIADTGLSLHTGACGALIALGCSDDEGEGAFSKLSASGLTPGETVYARVWEYANDAYGAFKVSAWDATLETASFGVSNFALYPNPVTDILTLSSTGEVTAVTVFNLLGQQVMVKPNSNFTQIDMSSLEKGPYLLKITTGNRTATTKIIKD